MADDQGNSDNNNQGDGNGGGGGNDEQRVPYDRFKEANERAKKAEKDLQSVQTELQQLRDSQESEQGKHKDRADRLKAENDQLKADKQQLERNLVRKDQTGTFRRMASGIIRSDALDDAFSMLPAEDLDKLDASDEDAFKRLADSLAENRPYLKDTARGQGSGGSEQPVSTDNGDGYKQPLPFGKFAQRRIS